MLKVLLHTSTLYKLAFYASAILVLSNCAYIGNLQQRAHYFNLANSISASSLQGVERFTSNAPISNSYKFKLLNSNRKSYSLLFSIHDSNFNKSTLSYRDDKPSLQDADRIDSNKPILNRLNQNLPKAHDVSWLNLDNLSIEEAQDSYELMLEYIRFKTRDI